MYIKMSTQTQIIKWMLLPMFPFLYLYHCYLVKEFPYHIFTAMLVGLILFVATIPANAQTHKVKTFSHSEKPIKAYRTSSKLIDFSDLFKSKPLTSKQFLARVKHLQTHPNKSKSKEYTGYRHIKSNPKDHFSYGINHRVDHSKLAKAKVSSHYYSEYKNPAILTALAVW